MHLQSAIEFLTTYAWAFLILGIFAVTVLVLTFSLSQGVQTYIPQSCYIEPSLPCYQALLLTNSTSAKFVVILQNNLGVSLSFPPNALLVEPSIYASTRYGGSCLPQNAIAGATIICNATFSSKGVPAGAQLTSIFSINYRICSPNCAQKIYNTTGNAVIVATPYKSVLFDVRLSTSPTTGKIAIGGVRYGNSANVIFISGLRYTVYAVPPTGYTFNSWIASSNITLGGASQSTTAVAAGPGSLAATFSLIP